MLANEKQFPTKLEGLIEDFDAWVRGGKTPHDAAVSAQKFGLSLDECEILKKEYLRRNQRFIDYKDPRVLRDNHKIESWYSGPEQQGAWCWPAYRDMLRNSASGWAQDDFASLDKASTKILASLPHPGTGSFNCRGLVIGYVQSGKTSNYSALIAKSADVGYRLFIVLSGITSVLRQQTQERLNRDVVNHVPANWSWLTYPMQDFPGTPTSPDSVIDIQSHKRRVIAVIKKNVRILDRLTQWLRSASPDTLAACPVIIIDDEADNASVNTKDPDVDPSAVNDRIRRLLASLTKVAYVGYTATPFANIFIDPKVPEDLFPRDFIFDLDRPKSYFGAERIFGRELLWFDVAEDTPDGLDIVRDVSIKDPDEPGMLLPTRAKERFDFQPSTPPSLREAIWYFLLATSARYARGQTNEHSTMLVHTTMYVDLHDKMQSILDDELRAFKSGYENLVKEIEALWSKESVKVPPAQGSQTPFNLLLGCLPAVLERAEVVVDNGRVESVIKYSREKPRVLIAVGGNTFSRGLTLEGLLVSYYIRRAGAYDTLLQMGRWFGYRPGYEDLPRIWMTNDLQEQFLFLAGIEEEIRQDIHRLENEQKTPLDLAIRVRTHPKLTITARNKMRMAKLASASFSERTLQSFLFCHDDTSWLHSNLQSARTLGAQVQPMVKTAGDGRYLVSDVAVATVLDFFKNYRFHPDQVELRRDLIEKYILKENEKDSLRHWNIAWLGQIERQDVLGSMDLGFGSHLNCISRSRFRMTSPCNIKALISKSDRSVDLTGVSSTATDKEIIDLRNEQAGDTGLLLLYPISKYSTPHPRSDRNLAFCSVCERAHQVPKEGAAVRHPLGAVEDIVGVALVFPKSKWGEANYMANDLADLFNPEQAEDGELIPVESAEFDG